MNGLEYLKNELKQRGFYSNQSNSKIVAATLDILTNSGDKYTKMAEKDKEATELYSHYERLLARYEATRSEVKVKWEMLDEYVKEFNQSIKECETAEGRDRLKLAQMYVNSVTVDTCYDRTAFIIGLASVLSGGNIAAINSLRAINNEIPDPSFNELKII